MLSSRTRGGIACAARFPRRARTLTATYRERTTASGDLKLAYQEWGPDDGPVILALHGFGVSGHMFDEFGQRASDRYRLINLDQRGHGDSEWASDGDYTREAFVADVEAVREGLGFESVILMGHSMGGLNAVEYTFQHPERVSALILVDVGPEAAKEGVDNIMRFTRGPDELDFDEFVQNAMRFNTRRTEENIRERMRHRLRPLENGKWTWKFDKRFREGEGAVRSGSELSSDELWRRFRELAPPVLLLRGQQSDILSQEVAERTAGEIPAARLVVVPEAGHSVPGDNPDGFTEAVTAFLDDVGAGRFAEAEADSTPIPIPDDIDELRRGWRARERRIPGVALVAGAAVAVTAVAAAGAFLFSRFRRGRRDDEA
ncbi:MAG: alpha/beta hydrolase [Dehalococcoidia bacterium]|nr:alpha/beta hydrolase [Dehalococcoidia bacterium]MYD27886.1 alpha/beta hydrolase [Dehalococcoidia bacterium]